MADPPDQDAERRRRAAARRDRLTVRRVPLDEVDAEPITGAEAISLAYRLSRVAWTLSGRELPSYTRAETPFVFVPSSEREP